MPILPIVPMRFFPGAYEVISAIKREEDDVHAFKASRPLSDSGFDLNQFCISKYFGKSMVPFLLYPFLSFGPLWK